MFKRTWSMSIAICYTHKIFLSEYIWMTWSRNSTCISSHIYDNGTNILGSRSWPF